MTVQRVELSEYETATVPLSAQAARDLDEVALGRLTLGLGADPGTFTITATSYVGTVVTPGLEVLVRPKVSMENLFMLLDVGLPAKAWSKDTFAFGTDRSLLAAVAAFFARTLERTVAAGLLRSYRGQQERVMALRGRIDFAEVNRRPAMVAPIACAFDEYTADVTENRILRAALARLLRIPGVRPETRRALMLTLARFEEVAEVPVEPDAVLRLRFTRLNRHYEPALHLARLILRNTTLADRIGSADASAFLLDMNELFQRWLGSRLTRALRGRLEVHEEPAVHLAEQRKVSMAPDLVFRTATGVAYAGDIKYKLASSGLARSGDYYQLLAYATALRLEEGVLVYCQTEGEHPDRDVVVRNAGTILWTYRLDMSGSPAEVEQRVLELADWIETRSQISVFT